MNEGEKSLIWDLLIPHREFKEAAKRLLKRPLGALDWETVYQDMCLDCWSTMTNKGFWITKAKNYGRDLIKHELVEQKYQHKLGDFMDNCIPEVALYDPEITSLTTKHKPNDKKD